MDAKHAKHLRATEPVEALWSEQESQDAMYRIVNASIQDSRDVVCQIAPVEAHRIANILPQMESSEFLEPVLFRLESRRTKGPVVKLLHEFSTMAVGFHRTKAGAE